MAKIPDFIPVHWLRVQTFCEYQLYLTEVKGVADQESDAICQGRDTHTDLEAAHDIKVTGVATLSDAIDKALATSRPFVMREAPVKGNRLTGLVDQIEFYLDKVYVVDDKPRSPNGDPYLSDKRQVKAYCLAFLSQYPDLRLPVFAVIHDRDTSRTLWRQQFTMADREDIADTINRIIGILDGTRQPVPSKNWRKCTHCRFSPHCSKSLAR